MCAAKTNNEINVTILEDGTVRIETGAFEGAKHAAAEALLRHIGSELGETRRTRKPHTHTRAHHHDHKHEKH